MFGESDLLEGLRAHDEGVMKHLYREYFPMIKSFIEKNGGSEEDALDILQEGMVVLYQKAAQEDFEWTSTLKTYLYSVCRNKWLMELRRKRNKPESAIPETLMIAGDESVESDIVESEKRKLMKKYFKRLGDDCQQILQMFFEGKSLKEIAQAMDFTAGYAKKRKFICQKRLIESISSDPTYRELANI